MLSRPPTRSEEGSGCMRCDCPCAVYPLFAHSPVVAVTVSPTVCVFQVRGSVFAVVSAPVRGNRGCVDRGRLIKANTVGRRERSKLGRQRVDASKTPPAGLLSRETEAPFHAVVHSKGRAVTLAKKTYISCISPPQLFQRTHTPIYIYMNLSPPNSSRVKLKAATKPHVKREVPCTTRFRYLPGALMRGLF